MVPDHWSNDAMVLMDSLIYIFFFNHRPFSIEMLACCLKQMFALECSCFEHHSLPSLRMARFVLGQKPRAFVVPVPDTVSARLRLGCHGPSSTS